jgi:3-isopropylmalate/(R)-2-methylmalate dehydratase small subunit
MKAVTTIIGPAAPLLRDNVDTDLIIRIERISQLKRGQLGPYVLETLRYRGNGPESGEREDFVLNQPAFRHACTLLGGKNFGDIFYNNCLQNGLLAVRLDAEVIERIATASHDGANLEVDLRALEIRARGIDPIRFEFDEAPRAALLEGLDEIDQTRRMSEQIAQFRADDRKARGWAYLA